VKVFEPKCPICVEGKKKLIEICNEEGVVVGYREVEVRNCDSLNHNEAIVTIFCPSCGIKFIG